jgi:hypothetical protein
VSTTVGFRAPNAAERLLNRAFGLLVRLGLGLPHHYLLCVRGRRTGREHCTPVNLLTLDRRRYLVAGRGRTQWVRNAEVAGAITLVRGRHREHCRLRTVAPAEKPAILRAYLDRFRITVQRYFPLPAGSPEVAFIAFVDRFPVFEVVAP